jgi:hypothetical protein
MSTRLSGTLEVKSRFTGEVSKLGEGRYEGTVRTNKGTWSFSELWVPPIGDPTSPETYDRVAAAAIYWGGLFSAEDTKADAASLPSWAPSSELSLVIRNGREVFPVTIVGDEPISVPGVYVAKTNTVIFHNIQSRKEYYAALERMAHPQVRRARFRIINGG